MRHNQQSVDTISLRAVKYATFKLTQNGCQKPRITPYVFSLVLHNP